MTSEDGRSRPGEIRVELGDETTTVSTLLRLPEEEVEARALLVLGHGAGAAMEHRTLEALAEALAARGVATLRYNFPYMEARRSGSRRPPDRRPRLLATVAAAVAEGRRLLAEEPRLRGCPLLAGGKSMGGRMTSEAAAAGLLDAPAGEPELAGIVFFGFPLHPPKKPEKAAERAEHLPRVPVPLLFLQGTRDDLADLDLLRPVCERLGEKATLHITEGADHSFHVLKRSGRTDGEVLAELAGVVAGWTALER